MKKSPSVRTPEGELPEWVARWLDESDAIERKVGWPEVFVMRNRAGNLAAWRDTAEGQMWAVRLALRDLGRELWEARRSLAAWCAFAGALFLWGSCYLGLIQ